MLSLALGIGANTAIFSIINSLLLRPLPVQDPQRLASMVPEKFPPGFIWTFRIWEQIHKHNELYQRAFAWSAGRFNLSPGGETQFAEGLYVSGGMFETLGVPAILGRTLTEADDQRGGGRDGPVVVISYRFWQRHFGGATDVIGRQLSIERLPFTIVGVTPPSFFGPEVGRSFDLAIPIGTEPLIRGKDTHLDQPWSYWLGVMMRLKDGQSTAAASTALQALQPEIRASTLPEGPPTRVSQYLKDKMAVVPAGTGTSWMRFQYTRPLFTMLVVVALVLLIACANIANLLLSRATARRHEWSVRRALGASRWRVMRLVLLESLLLSGVGAILGIAFARAGSRLIVNQLSTASRFVFLDLPLDWRVLAFTMAAGVMTALIFGTAAAFRAASADPIDALKASGRGHGADARGRVASAMVIVQIALSLVLVVASGLFVRTLHALTSVDLGFERDSILMVQVSAMRAHITIHDRLHTWAQVHERVQAVPGVAAAAVSFMTPFSTGYWSTNVVVSDTTPPAGDRRAGFNAVTPGWFTTYGIPLLAGRDFTDRDRGDRMPVIIVNEAFVKRFLKGANPIGHTVKLWMEPPASQPRQIVGLVRNALYDSVRDAAPPTMYIPVAQYYDESRDAPPSRAIVSLRGRGGSPALLTRPVAAAIGEVNHDLALTVSMLSDEFSASMIQERLVAWLASFFGGLALLLAGLGLYGVTAYAVSLRRAEIGIRMALGAVPTVVVRFVLGRVAVLIGMGIIVGIGVSMWATTLVTSFLFGLEPRDPVTLITACLILAAVGALAGWLPARRASRVDPAQVLRSS
jgi:putative ABC transport system permease protein